MSDSLRQLQTKLREMFEFDNHDLDFGIYKIYNLKNAEVSKFIEGEDEQSLASIIRQSLSQTSVQAQENERTLLYNFLSQYNKQDLLEDTETNQSRIKSQIELDGESEKESLIQALQSLLDPEYGAVSADKVYNHLLNFFALYYSHGDFGYNARSLAPYSVEYPDSAHYNGDDTMLMWKHKNQYYIKSGAGFNRVGVDVTVDGVTKTIEHRLESSPESEAETTARNNNKDTSTKHYRLDRIEEAEGAYQVIFQLANESTPKENVYKQILEQAFGIEYSDAYWHKKDGKSIFKELGNKNQDVDNGGVKGISQLRQTKAELLTALNDGIKKKDELPQLAAEDETFAVLWSLNKALNNFYIGHDADFFIHPDLRGFLRNERDKYVKNQVLGDLQSLLSVQTDNRSLLVAQAFVLASNPLIEFLSAVEDFQKNLFERPKQIVAHDYLIGAGMIASEHYPALVTNQELVANWRTLGFVETDTIEADFLSTHPTLPVDTKYLTPELKDAILAGIENLDTTKNGTLIKSENFQALNFLKYKYRGQIKCIYIDPPYNTGSDGFLYKDSFKHSSWLSFMQNRLELAKELLSDDGVIFISIDDNELTGLLELSNFMTDLSLESIFHIKVRHENRILRQDNRYQKVMEYLLCFSKSEYTPARIHKNTKSDDAYQFDVKIKKSSKPHIEEIGGYNVEIFKKEDYEISQSAKGSLKEYNIRGSLITQSGSASEFYEKNLRQRKQADSLGTLYKVIGMGTKGDGLGYRYIRQPNNAKGSNGFYYQGKPIKSSEDKGNPYPDFYDFEKEFNNLSKEGGVKFSNGKKPEAFIKQIFTIASLSQSDIVMDFFAGSGTTAAVAHKLGIKYVGIEMGDYFDDKTLVRMQNVIAGEQNGISKSVNWKGKGIVEYLTLEQYEDVLDNLEKAPADFPEGVGYEDLPLRYWYRPESLTLSSRLDVSDPFAQRTVVGPTRQEVDLYLPETYLYRMGYTLHARRRFDFEDWAGGYLAYLVGRGESRDTLVVFRRITPEQASQAPKNQDIEHLREILRAFPDVEYLEVNADIHVLALQDNRLTIDERQVEVRRINQQHFNS